MEKGLIEKLYKLSINGKNVNDILEMSVEEAVKFYKNHKTILRKLNALLDVGLGYIKLGQQATSLSGGESQKEIKLAKELSKVNTGKIHLYFR